MHVSSAANRRHVKGIERLRKHVEPWSGFRLSPNASKTVVIGNAGLACGFSSEDIAKIIEEVCRSSAKSSPRPVFEVVMLPDKPFTVLLFEEEKDAETCGDLLVGKSFPSASGQTLPWYPAFLQNCGHVSQSAANADHSLPPGLRVVLDFISEEEERQLIDFVDQALADCSSSLDTLKNRTALHYGYEFRYGRNDVDCENLAPNKIPDVCSDLLQRLLQRRCVIDIPDQVTVNVYEPGQGIPAHIDTHSSFYDGIVSLSLGGAVVMDFSRDSRTLPVILYPRSVIRMREECRYAWKHGITPRKTDSFPGKVPWRRARRISFTFRCVRREPCNCPYFRHCDSQSPGIERELLSSMSNPQVPPLQLPDDMEDRHVHKVYEEIAPHFSDTRHKPWPKIIRFLTSLDAGSLLVDVGCGNGKYFGFNKSLLEVGTDRSVGLTDICRERKLEVLVSDILTLPFRDSCCDAVICIAVIHHLSSEERRIKALKEIMRLLVDGGRALVYVWALEQKQNQKPSTYLKNGKRSGSGTSGCLNASVAPECKVDSPAANTASVQIHTNRTEFQSQDLLVPWHFKKKVTENMDVEERVFHRYYHVFREGELRRCCEALYDVKVVEEYYDEGPEQLRTHGTQVPYWSQVDAVDVCVAELLRHYSTFVAMV